MTNLLAAFSASVSGLAASSAPLVCAIRIGPNRHLTGLVCQDDTVVTTDQALPALESYTVVMSDRMLIPARPNARDPGCNLATLRLDTTWPAVNTDIAATSVGSLVIILGADADASPTARLSVVHRFTRTADGPAAVLDLSRDRVDPGSAVLDPQGRLIGLAAIGPNGEAMVIPGTLIGRMLMPALNLHGASADPQSDRPAPAYKPDRRAWLGVALQPITVPDQLVPRTGQTSGRMVVSLTKGGPAEKAGMRVGDVLLALNGTSTTGPNTLRALLGHDRIGTTVDIRLLRDGNVMTTELTLQMQPE